MKTKTLEEVKKDLGIKGSVEDPIRQYLKDEEYFSYVLNTAKLESEFTISPQIPTAAITFAKTEDEDIPIKFSFNPNFWAKLSYSEKCFVYGHEVFHVLFDHGRRGREFFKRLEIAGKKPDHRRLNQAMDICINELQMREHFDHLTLADMPEVAKGCFIETCFPKSAPGEILPGKSFEYYYEKLEEYAEEHGDGNGNGFDSVDFEGELSDVINDILDAIQKGQAGDDAAETPSGGNINEENYGEKKAESEAKASAGSGYSQDASMMTTEVTLQNTPEVNSLEDGIKLIRKYFSGRSTTYKTSYDWTRQSRRMMGIPKTCFIPNRDEVRKVTRQKIIIYADVSGSVAHYSERFIRLAIELDEKIFDFELIPWASYCGKVTIKGNNARFDGTGYGTDIMKVITDYKSRLAKGERFDSVLCLTDGEYSNIQSMDTDFFAKWTFFMTTNSKNAPKNSSIIKLKGF